jgi:5-methylcytosine-specific restriction endonuclease McrA
MIKSNDPRLTRRYKKQRLVVLARDGYTCAYCGQDADQVDHVVPISKDPNLAIDPSNLVACCRRCNVSKGSRSEAVFLARTATPPVFRGNTSPITVSTVHSGPAFGQPDQI